MLATALRSVLNAPPYVAWSSNAEHFYKSKAFVSPDASTIPPLEKFIALALGSSDLGGTAFNHKSETNHSSPDDFGMHPVEECWVANRGGISALPADIASLIVEGVRQPLLSRSPSTPSDLSSDESFIFSNRDATSSIATSTTSPVTSAHAGVPGWPRPITPFTKLDMISLRLTGEKSIDSSSATYVASRTGLTRIKAIAGWVAGFIYAQVVEGASAGGGVVGAHNADVHIRVTDRIRTVLESTYLPLPTVFLALWYISRFPFTVSTADGTSPRDVFYRLLCGYGTVHTEQSIFLAFIAGVMLANKTNDDFPLSIREWHHASLYDIKDLKFLEVSALKLFSWNIAIDSVQWCQWMGYITAYHSTLARHQAISQDYGVISCVIDGVKRQDPHWNCDCDRQCTISSSQLNLADDLTADFSDFPLPPYSPCQFKSHSTSPSVIPLLCPARCQSVTSPFIQQYSQPACDLALSLNREPSPWCPAADPIVEAAKPSRTMGRAPGSTWVESVTALDILDNITAERCPLSMLPGINRHYSAEAANTRWPPSCGTIGRV